MSNLIKVTKQLSLVEEIDVDSVEVTDLLDLVFYCASSMVVSNAS